MRFVKTQQALETNHSEIFFTNVDPLLHYLSQLRIDFLCIIAPFPHFNLDQCLQMSKSMGWDCLESPANILESPTVATLWCPALSPLPWVPPATNRATLQGGRNELWERGNSHSYTHISSRRISPSFSIYPSSYTLSSQFSIPTSLHKHIFYTETCPNICVKTS